MILVISWSPTHINGIVYSFQVLLFWKIHWRTSREWNLIQWSAETQIASKLDPQLNRQRPHPATSRWDDTWWLVNGHSPKHRPCPHIMGGWSTVPSSENVCNLLWGLCHINLQIDSQNQSKGGKKRYLAGLPSGKLPWKTIFIFCLFGQSSRINEP